MNSWLLIIDYWLLVRLITFSNVNCSRVGIPHQRNHQVFQLELGVPIPALT